MILDITKYAALTAMILMAVATTSYAGDFDDGIKMDEKIEKAATLGQPGINIEYIKRSAKASVNSITGSDKGNGDISIGSFINQPGAKVGDVTIIFNGEDINAISK